MNQEIIIQLENITKTYRLYKKHSNRVKETFHPFRKKYHESFKALSDVSLNIKRGETVGLIGRNGSGKSTLLQIICGILTPSAGNSNVNGRISALLELGAGFNPEFTGRENVYLNASILGLERKEIDSCFGEIEEFADIGVYIDQPVKSYSSGMYVRLAFAVAINVKPDILIVDEALSVGDTLFQSKCYANFREFQSNGVTILFVTHALSLITQYCDKAFLLDEGTLHMEGSPKEVVDEYNRLLVNCSIIHDTQDTKKKKEKSKIQQSGSAVIPMLWDNLFTLNPNENRYGNGKVTIHEVGIFSSDDQAVQRLITGNEYLFRMRVQFHDTVETPVFAYTIKDVRGFDISGTNTRFQKLETGKFSKGDFIEIVFTQKMILSSGSYILSFGCGGTESTEYVIYERRYDVLSFEVISTQPNVGFVDLKSNIALNRQ